MSQLLDQMEKFGNYLADQGHQISSMLSGSAASHADRLIRGPVVPIDFKQENRYMLPGAVASLYFGSTAVPFAPGAAALSAASIVPYLYPREFNLWDVGYNAHRMWSSEDWVGILKRQLLAPFIPTSATLAISSVAAFYPLAAQLEKRRGLSTLFDTLQLISAASNGIYLCAAKAAARFFPASALAAEYYTKYSVGWGPIIAGLQVFQGYDADESNSSSLDHSRVSRYNWGIGVMLLQYAAESSPYAPTATQYASGVLAGLLVTYLYGYGRAPAQWRKKADLGWRDIGIQLGLLGIWAGVSYLTAEERGGFF